MESSSSLEPGQSDIGIARHLIAFKMNRVIGVGVGDIEKTVFSILRVKRQAKQTLFKACSRVYFVAHVKEGPTQDLSILQNKDASGAFGYEQKTILRVRDTSRLLQTTSDSVDGIILNLRFLPMRGNGK